MDIGQVLFLRVYGPRRHRGQNSAILTEQTLSIKNLLYGFWLYFSYGTRRVSPSGQDHRWPKLDIWAALYMLTFALLRDSSDLHIYKDLYGENNDFFYNLWKCSDLNKNRLTLLELSVFSLLCGLWADLWSFLLVLEEPVCPLYIYFPRLGTRTKQSIRSAEGKRP